jgi:hypothetical protein
MKAKLLAVLMLVWNCAAFAATDDTAPVVPADDEVHVCAKTDVGRSNINTIQKQVDGVGTADVRKVVTITIMPELDEKNSKTIQRAIDALKAELKRVKNEEAGKKTDAQKKTEQHYFKEADADREHEPNSYLTKDQAMNGMRGNVSAPYVIESELEACHLDNGSLV